jgi:hypothetical protein
MPTPKTTHGTYYKWNCKTPRSYSKTPKQFRVHGTERTVILKPTAEWNNLNNTLHTYTFADGTTRQWFFSPKFWSHYRRDENTLDYIVEQMKEQLGRDLASDEANDRHSVPFSCDFCFVAHPDDKTFYRTRLAQVIPASRAKDDYGFSTSAVYYGEKMTLNTLPVVVCETWVRWGRMDILLDDGLRSWTHYDIGDSRRINFAPRKGRFLPLPEFRASPKSNPFDDPFEPELKEIRDKQNDRHEELAQKAFHPDRVWRMMDTYGEDWMERV